MSPLAAVSLLVASAVNATGAPPTGKEVGARLAPKLPALVATYKDIHQNPELGAMEARTSAIVAKRLRTLGFQVTDNFGRYENGKAAYGVVAVLKNGPGPTVLIREDMDALPVVETTGLPYASKAKVRRPDGSEVGVMHACGHDVHTTILLGTAEMLVEMKDRWSGTLVMIGQPAEESLSGARAMLGAGLYEKFGRPDFTLGMHVLGELPAGVVAVSPGPAMANVDTLHVTMRGFGSHGSRPWNGIDPIVMSAAFIMEVQTLVSREIQTGKPAVVTIGAINGGTAPNVIPNEVTMKMTVRSFEPEVRQKLLTGIARIAKGVAIGRGVPEDHLPVVEHIKNESTDVTYNDPALTAQLFDLWKQELDEVRAIEPRTGGEDFTFFSANRTIPSVYAQVGASDPKLLEELARSGKPVPTTHQSGFAPVPEPTIRSGVMALVTAATNLLKARPSS